MIHQLIFAAPKPGMTEQEFQDYWINVHAERYASKIPQIVRYAVDARVDVGLQGPQGPGWGGIAEIWLNNDEEQLASLQTPEFLEGARLDEPRWAAFWLSLVMDTDTTVVVEGPPMNADSPETKVFILLKRRAGESLEGFRKALRDLGPEQVDGLPGLVRYWQGFTRDGAYGIGEAPLDAALQFSFANRRAAADAVASPAFVQLLHRLEDITETRYTKTLAAAQHWVVGP